MCEFWHLVSMPWKCPWSRGRQTGPKISGPLHLLLKKDGLGQSHCFRNKVFKKPTPCHWCHQPIVHQGSCCRVCKYVCHPACETKDAARFSDTSWQIHQAWSREGRAPAVPPTPPTLTVNGAPPTSFVDRDHPDSAPVHSKGNRDPNGIYDSLLPRAVSAPPTPAGGSVAGKYQSNGDIGIGGARLDLCYVAERMLALWLPTRDAQAERQAAHMLATKHADHYMVFEVSGVGGRAARAAFGRARALGWPAEMAPPLERLCAACKHVDRWLAAHPRNVAVLLAWGSRERLGVVVAAYMHYSAICGAAEQALDRFAMRRYLDDRVGQFRMPSNKRYVDTFAGLLAGHIRVNSAPLYLTHVTLVGGLGAAASPAHTFFKVYEGLICVYTSGVYSVGAGAARWTAAVGSVGGGLAVRGDVLVRAYRRVGTSTQRALLYSVHFHTCAVGADLTLTFTKQELDHACNDPTFPPDGVVELQLSPHSSTMRRSTPAPAPSPNAPLLCAAPDELARRDSLEHLRRAADDTDDDNEGEGEAEGGSASGGESAEAAAAHTFGPLDGSIYATVQRRSPPLSASMDSGISSAGRQRASPAAAPAPANDPRAELDALLGDMLETVSALPDHCPSDRRTRNTSTSDTRDDIPYHAREHSRPFTYGVPGLDPGMLRNGARLASPELVRRALGKPPIIDTDDDREDSDARDSSPFRTSLPARATSTPAPRRAASALAAVPPSFSVAPSSPIQQKKLTHEDVTTTTTTTNPPLVNGNWLNGDWTDKSPSNGRILDSKLSDDSWKSSETSWRDRSRGEENGWQDTFKLKELRQETKRIQENGDGASSGLTWLQRQQQKLREKKDARMRTGRLPMEWGTNSRHVRQSASHRLDGYTSDTTAFADDDDDFSIPLHVHTERSARSHTDAALPSPSLPTRTTSRKFMFAERTAVREWAGSTGSGSGLLSLAQPLASDNTVSEQAREESYSSWRSTSPSEAEWGRAGTPAFPTHPRTPYAPTPPAAARATPPLLRRCSSPEWSAALSTTSRSARSSPAPELHVAPERVRFARDTSHYWYKPTISRDEAIALLQKPGVSEGAFVVRDSNSFPGAFGLAVRASGGVVRHFLVEAGARGVRLRGCADEPCFATLSALVYQHTVTPLALPCLLQLPDRDPLPAAGAAAAARALLSSGAACQVLLLGAECTEALTGPAAVRRAVARLLQRSPAPVPHTVHFKVSAAGITLTDSARKLFFRRHYPAGAVSHCGLDPDERRWSHANQDNHTHGNKRIFAFVARSGGADNMCHIFAELEPEQPATAIVNFVVKALLGTNQKSRDIV